MPLDDEWIKKYTMYLKKIEKNLREKFQENGSRSEKVNVIMQKQLCFGLYTPS